MMTWMNENIHKEKYHDSAQNWFEAEDGTFLYDFVWLLFVKSVDVFVKLSFI